MIFIADELKDNMIGMRSTMIRTQEKKEGFLGKEMVSFLKNSDDAVELLSAKIRKPYEVDEYGCQAGAGDTIVILPSTQQQDLLTVYALN